MQEKKHIEECERWKVTPKGHPFLEEIILHFWIGAGVDVKGYDTLSLESVLQLAWDWDGHHVMGSMAKPEAVVRLRKRWQIIQLYLYKSSSPYKLNYLASSLCA